MTAFERRANIYLKIIFKILSNPFKNKTFDTQWCLKESLKFVFLHAFVRTLILKFIYYVGITHAMPKIKSNVLCSM